MTRRPLRRDRQQHAGSAGRRALPVNARSTAASRGYGRHVGALTDRRVLIVGASKGLGAAFVDSLAREGAQVFAAARTIPSASELPRGVRAASCDVREPESCRAVVAECIDHLGGLDALVYAPGVAVVTELRDATSDHWRSVFETNVIGSGLVTAAAVDHLAATEGIAVFFSSVSAHVTPPWVGIGLYAASKAALEKSVQVWKL